MIWEDPTCGGATKPTKSTREFMQPKGKFPRDETKDPTCTTKTSCSQIYKYFKIHNIHVNRNGQRTLRKYTDGQQARGKVLRYHYSVQFSSVQSLSRV